MSELNGLTALVTGGSSGIGLEYARQLLERGRRTVSPGLMNVLLPPIIALIPNRLKDRLGIKWMLKK